MARSAPRTLLAVTAADGLPRGQVQHTIDILTTLIAFIFSWVILLPTSIIIAGKFLAAIFPMKGISRTILRIPLWIFRLEAQNDEVILGFAGFLITFALVAFSGGQAFYKFAALQFGIDPGQFHTLCFSSAIFTVAWSATLWLLARIKPPGSGDQTKVKKLMRDIGDKIASEDDRR